MNKIERQLEESYKNISNYLSDEESTKELRKMCKNCERYCGKSHDYTECRDMQCFKFYLAYNYLKWCNGYSF